MREVRQWNRRPSRAERYRLKPQLQLESTQARRRATHSGVVEAGGSASRAAPTQRLPTHSGHIADKRAIPRTKKGFDAAADDDGVKASSQPGTIAC